jgi:hypothetical protein
LEHFSLLSAAHASAVALSHVTAFTAIAPRVIAFFVESKLPAESARSSDTKLFTGAPVMLALGETVTTAYEVLTAFSASNTLTVA